ncbi:hypothetical protein PIB30_000953 [Stylosanthes scabra]|uniref:Dirigent protein n=1 Tax=Stylosanthes scabra TaxID=79078 RepID=A0ABU6S356_9FABA|nr:hypothetical protein [Stylosanthes scabra]
MATPSLLLLLLFFFLFLFSSNVAAKQTRFYRSMSPTSLGLHKEKLTHLHFYFHDVVSGPNPSAIIVAQAQTTKNSPTLFGALAVSDDALTVGPEPNSKVVGKAQGMYAFASHNEIGLVMAMNLEFSEGKYNGSTLSLFGRNPVLKKVREIPIVGGSGVFRFAHGYAELKTEWFNITSGNAVVEYNYNNISPSGEAQPPPFLFFFFYFHNVVNGPNLTALRVAQAQTTSFGAVNVVDNPLKIGPESSSKVIGKAQGMRLGY